MFFLLVHTICVSRPPVNDLVEYCDGAYTAEELFKCELDMFAMLDFDLAQPYALQFLRRFVTSKKDELEGETYDGAKMLIELSTLGESGYTFASLTTFTDNDMISVPFSVIAAAALKLSMNTCQPDLEWDADLCYWTSFKPADIQVVVQRMENLIKVAARSLPKKPMGKVASRHRQQLPSFKLSKDS